MKLDTLRNALLALPFAIGACGKANSEAASDTKAEKPAAAASSIEIFPTDMIKGSDAAKVTLIEYASVTCPHCATFNEQILPPLHEKYVDTGKVRFIYREFPTAPANYSVIGSLLARCAAEKNGKDAYFLINDALFRAQQTWIFGESPKAELIKIISQAGMDEAALDACLKREDLIAVINKNAESGSKTYGVTGTPSFILNGVKMSFKTKEEFEQQIAAAVEKAGS